MASNVALCVQFSNHSDHMELLLTVGSEGSPSRGAEPSRRADRWDELQEGHLEVNCRWVHTYQTFDGKTVYELKRFTLQLSRKIGEIL